MAILKTKLPSSTLIEVIVAMLILCTVFALALSYLVKVRASSVNADMANGYLLLDQDVETFKTDSISNPTTNVVIGNYTISRHVTESNIDNNFIIYTTAISNTKSKKKILERRIVMLKKKLNNTLNTIELTPNENTTNAIR